MALQSSEMPKWRQIFDVPVAAIGFTEASQLVQHSLNSKTFMRVNFLNANNANISANSDALTSALKRSVVLSDGVGLDIASRVLYGAPFPANMNGTDFIPRLLKDLTQPLTIGLVGSTLEVVTEAAIQFTAIAPHHNFVVISDGFFSAKNVEKVINTIHLAKPDILFVGMGTPSQELWADQFIGENECTIVFTVGALFDFISRRVVRAPQALRNLKLEWLFRLALEPRRLFRRYVLGNPIFIFRALRQKITGKSVEQNDDARPD